MKTVLLPRGARRGARNTKAVIWGLLNMPSHSHPKLDYNYITDGIYIGTNQCCQAHFDERLIKKGISADISLEDQRLDAPFGVQFYIWIPVKNHTAPKSDQMSFGVSVLERLSVLERRMYVHCKNGHGRAPTLAAAYLMKKRGISPAEAEGFIKSQRSSVHIEPVQRKALVRFARSFVG